jgi:hypothetical protein
MHIWFGGIYMNKKDSYKWLDVEGATINIQMPNEIFDDFRKCDKFKSWKHRAFSYCYYYLINYIYRNALYGVNTEEYGRDATVGFLTSRTDPFSYIIKRNGLLDNLGYTESTKDIPVIFYMDNDILEFEFYDYSILPTGARELNRNFWIKKPVLSFHRMDDEFLDGTYYDFQSTHLVGVKDFVAITQDESLGYVGLYLYAYLKMMCVRYKEKGFLISNKTLGRFLDCNERTVIRYTKKLEEKGYIESKRTFYKPSKSEKVYFTH